MGSQRFDHSYGNAFVCDGVMYYSPNCSQVFPVPPKPSCTAYPFRPNTDRYEKYIDTVWVTAPLGFLAFIPSDTALFSGPLFSCLQDSEMYIVRLDNGRYALEPSVEAQWLELELRLIIVTGFLNPRVSSPAMRPPPPSMLNPNKSYAQFSWATEKIRRYRDWFLIWIALAAYLFAQEEDNTVRFQDIPNWYFRFLRENPEFPQSWLSDFRAFVFDYLVTKPFRRVGAVLDPFDRSYLLPPVDWFYKWNVPIWYRWGPAELRYTKTFDNGLAFLQPPADILRRATTYTPSTAPDMPIQLPGGSTPTREVVVASHGTFVERSRMRAAYIKTEPWKAFFDSRKTAHDVYLKTETAAQRMARLNREKNPPTASAEVYLWDWSDDDPCELVRTRVPKGKRECALFSSSLWRHYDAHLNVWEVCRYFGFAEECPGGGHNGDDTDDEDDDMELPGFDPRASTPPSPEANLMEAETAAFDPRASTPEAVLREVETAVAMRLGGPLRESATVQTVLNLLDSQPVDVPHYLSLLYGFLWPLPYPMVNIAADTTFWEKTIKNVGLRMSTPPHPTMPASIIAFLRGLCSKKPDDGPPDALFDLISTSRAPISRSAIQRKIPEVGGLFVVQSSAYRRGESCDWLVALTSPADAARAFRMLSMDAHSPVSLTLQLADMGITFRTLRRLPFSPTITLSSPPTLIPVRVHDHVFTADDYSAYVDRRARILSSPRGRAALLAGGLVWRLALEHLGIESVGSGPSSAVVRHGLGFVFKAPNGHLYGDDDLTRDEFEAICGLYHCHTGTESSYPCRIVSHVI